jgi:uncharacterized protein (DUF2336 family)
MPQMHINASNDFISELDRAIEGGSPARRCHMLRQIASLFLAGADRLDAHQIGFFDDVLLRLMESVETSTLSHLSAMLAALAAAPKEAVRRLAHNEDAMVAGPVLVRSEALSDSDLIEIAGNRGQAHLLAISGRTYLSEALTDAILRRNDAASCRVLAKNEGAHFSDRGYSALVARAERDDDIADSLMLRPHFPASIRAELLARATPAVRARLLKIASPETRGAVQATLERIAVEASTKRPAPTDYTAAKSIVLALSKAGKLNDSSVNRFAVREERANLIAALSLLSDAAIETIEAVVDPCGLIVACRGSRLNWTTTLAVVRYRCGVQAIPPADIERRREAFEALPLSVAQRTIRFGSVHDLAMESNLKGKTLLTAGAR